APPPRAQLERLAAGDRPEELAPLGEHAFDLQIDGRIAEARGELEGEDAASVDDAVDIDVAGVALQAILPASQRFAKQPVVAEPEGAGTHLACRWPDVSVEHALVLEVDQHRRQELLAVEERADGHLDPGGELLQLKAADLRPPALL